MKYKGIPLVINDESKMFRQKELPAIRSILAKLDIRKGYFVRFPETDFLEIGSNSVVGLIPGYKMLIQLTAMAYAQKLGKKYVLLGNSKQNTEFKDEQYKNVKKLEALYNTVYGTDIKVECPLQELEKYEIIKMAKKIKLPFGLTQSCCNQFTSIDCGICSGCIKRKEGFKLAKINDI